MTAWLSDRLALGRLDYPIPRHANRLAYLLGGVTFVTFLVLAASGLYLALFYRPDAEAARASVAGIVEGGALGATVRGIHYWAASVMVAVMALHLIRAFLYASFKSPREATWFAGLLLLGATGVGLYTGTILKFDQEGSEALHHTVAASASLGPIGDWVGSFLSGDALLPRLAAIHYVAVPGTMVALLFVHLALVRAHGISPLPWGSRREADARYESARRVGYLTHLARLGAWSVVLIGLLLTLAGLFPPSLGPEAVPGIEITKPPWYFLWLYPLESALGLNALMIGPLAVTAVLLAIPFFDRGRELDPRRRPIPMAVLGVLVAGWLGLTLYAGLTGVTQHLG